MPKFGIILVKFRSFLSGETICEGRGLKSSQHCILRVLVTEFQGLMCVKNFKDTSQMFTKHNFRVNPHFTQRIYVYLCYGDNKRLLLRKSSPTCRENVIASRSIYTFFPDSVSSFRVTKKCDSRKTNRIRKLAGRKD